MSDSFVLVGEGSGPEHTGGIAQVLAVHAALLPIGNRGAILYYAGDQWAEPKTWEAAEIEANSSQDPQHQAALAEISHARLYDCATARVYNPGSPPGDLFCSGHAVVQSGDVVIAGGTQHWPPTNEQADLHHAHWSGSRDTWVFSCANAAMAGAAGAKVAALWAPDRPAHLDVFMTTTAGTVVSSWWESGKGWQPWFSIGAVVEAVPGGSVTAVWQTGQPPEVPLLNLFITDLTGQVWLAKWSSLTGWTGWGQIREIKAAPGAEVSVVLTGGGGLVLFVPDVEGSIWTTFYRHIRGPHGGWQPWLAIAPMPRAADATPITAQMSKLDANRIDVFATGSDGMVRTTSSTSHQTWLPWAAVGGAQTVKPSAPVTAIWSPQSPPRLELFVSRADGTVSTSSSSNGTTFSAWATVAPNHRAQPGAEITAVWSAPSLGCLSLFMAGTDGAVWTTYKTSTAAWQSWSTIAAAQKASRGGPITAVWAKDRPEHLDLFMTGSDGTWWSTWWESYPGWQAWFHIPKANPWIKGPLLNRDPDQVANGYGGGGRWYPTLITLNTGEVFAHTGHPLIWEFTGKNFGDEQANVDIRHNNTKPEILNAQHSAWTIINKQLGVSGAHDFAPYYPRLHVMPHTGNVFCVQPLYSKMVVPENVGTNPNLMTANQLDLAPPYIDVMDKSFFYDINSTTVTAAFDGPQKLDPLYLDRFFTSQPTTSVLLPLLHEENYFPRCLLAGAVQPLIADLAPVGTIQPQWVATAARMLQGTSGTPPERKFCNATLLPTGEVIVTGGVLMDAYEEADGVRTAEVFTPPQDGLRSAWRTGAVAAETRGYHSSALLMPDGRVWTAGSEIEFQHPPAAALPKLAVELYQPWYYGIPGRVQIADCPAWANYGHPFTVTFEVSAVAPALGQIYRVVLMRCGSVTHSLDGDQRLISVPFTQSETQPSLVAMGPPDSTVAPPGVYMLFLVSSGNIPCMHAWWIRFKVKPRGGPGG